MKTKVAVEDAVGMVLPHDITEIVKERFKGPAFKKGHVIQSEDIEHLKRLGKEHIYILELGTDDIHENEAALLLAAALAGPGTVAETNPSEGKLSIHAAHDGLLQIDTDALYHFNLLGEVMCSTLHTDFPVKKGEQIGATRLIPLIGKRLLVNEAIQICEDAGSVVRVLPLRSSKTGLVITGTEVFSGRIKDGFEPVLRDKLAAIGSEILTVRFAPDDEEQIATEIRGCLDQGADLIITSGGMSVDPDDVTRAAIRRAGATDIVYGTPVLPGAMFLAARIGDIPILGLPACAMYNKTTVLDLVLPRILAGQAITRESLAAMGHGGLCRSCEICRFPICDFGK